MQAPPMAEVISAQLFAKALRPDAAERVVLPDLQACWHSLPFEGIASLAELLDTIFYSPSITLRSLPTAVADHVKEIARTLE